jgi:outer membrane scaffolding protein for murein synthesis (MipA/OmpV family)
VRRTGVWLALWLPCAAWAAEATNNFGVAAWSHPVYDGDATQQVMAIPTVSYYGDVYFARTTQGVLEGGARADLFRNFAVGVQLAYEGGRDSTASPFLTSHNVASIAPNVSAGAHAELKLEIGPMPLWLLLRYRQHADGASGAQADMRLTAGVYGGDNLEAGVFVQSTWADSTAMQSYYGIGALQAAGTGLAAYTAEQGRMFNSEGILWSYALGPEWELLGSLEARQLQGNALNSPLAQVSANAYASVGIAYRF